MDEYLLNNYDESAYYDVSAITDKAKFGYDIYQFRDPFVTVTVEGQEGFIFNDFVTRGLVDTTFTDKIKEFIKDTIDYGTMGKGYSFYIYNAYAGGKDLYVKIEDIMEAVDYSLKHIIDNLEILTNNETEENSFKTLALMWSDLPAATEESIRAVKNSKAGYIKLVLIFMISQKLMAQSEERYYLKDRARALIENYFEESKGRLYEIIQGKEKEDATY